MNVAAHFEWAVAISSCIALWRAFTDQLLAVRKRKGNNATFADIEYELTPAAGLHYRGAQQ